MISMNKYILELVLMKAVNLLSPKLKESVTFPDIFHLAHLIWEDENFQGTLGIYNSYNEKEFYLKRHEIEKILTNGMLEKEDNNDAKNTFILEDYSVNTMIMESGKVMIYHQEDDGEENDWE